MEARLCAAHAQHVREARPRPGPYLQDAPRKEMSTSQWVWTLQGEKQMVSVASRTQLVTAEHVCGMPCVWPWSASLKGTGLAQNRL